MWIPTLWRTPDNRWHSYMSTCVPGQCASFLGRDLLPHHPPNHLRYCGAGWALNSTKQYSYEGRGGGALCMLLSVWSEAGGRSAGGYPSQSQPLRPTGSGLPTESYLILPSLLPHFNSKEAQWSNCLRARKLEDQGNLEKNGGKKFHMDQA